MLLALTTFKALEKLSMKLIVSRFGNIFVVAKVLLE
jgi:hypothetical protein